MSEPSFVFTIPAPTPETPRRRRMNGAMWLIGVGLIANALVMLTRAQVPEIAFDRQALGQAVPAQPGQLLGARGIYMMPAQLGPNAFGMYLMDVDSGTICVYRVNPDTSRFRLMASRSYKYDRFLEDYNNDPMRPKDVQTLVEDQRKRVELKGKDDQPTVDQNPKPDENAPDKPKESP